MTDPSELRRVESGTVVPARLRARRRKRGAAMVEAVVVLPFFIIVLASLGYIARLYGTRQQVGADSRKCAWLNAVNSCEGALPPECSAQKTSDGNLANNGVQDLNPDDGDADSISNSSPGAVSLQDSFGSTVVEVSRDASAAQLLGASAPTVKASTKVMCNEKARGTDVAQILDFTYQTLTGQNL